MDILGTQRFIKGPTALRLMRRVAAGDGGGPDYSTAQVGDEIGGGIYAGTITYADARQFHLVFGFQASEQSKAILSSGVGTYPTDPDDGLANTQAMVATGNTNWEAAFYCDGYASSGFGDWYLPARNEIAKVGALVASSHPDFSTDLFNYRHTSTMTGTGLVWDIRFSDGHQKTETRGNPRFVRPIRRVPV